VYAIGECAEHRGQTYGLVAPLWDQARVLADRLSGNKPHASYEGSCLSTKLKVAGLDVAVMGAKEAAEEEDEVVSYAEPSRGVYKKLVVRNNRVVGAILIGDGPIVPTISQAFVDGRQIAARARRTAVPRHRSPPSEKRRSSS
jgi:nitrite reductase (NADH) large subunit